MKEFIMSALAGWLALYRTSAPPLAESSQIKPANDYLVLLHGLGRTAVSMKGLEWYFQSRGFRVINVNYPSAGGSIEHLADRYLDDALTKEIADQTVKVHFVTHSLGGILLRQYLSNHTLTNLGQVVMLAPPNQGSELADYLKSRGPGRWILGRSGQQLGTTDSDVPKRLGPVHFDLGVIAGDRSLNPWFSRIIPGPDDGKVSVENTKVEGMKDFRVVHSSHTWLMWRRQTVRQIEHFLAQGRFDHP
jgi:triacylglycerol lipase